MAQPRPIPPDAPLVTDLSTHRVAINSSFTGTEVLVFGAVDAPGDIVVVVRGPAAPLTVRRKERVAGIWLNRRAVEFESVPAFYAVGANRPLPEIASSSLLGRLQIGTTNIRLAANVPEEQAIPFREAILRNKERDGLFESETLTVTVLGNRLFRATFDLPATVPVGTYRAEVYLIRDDRVIAAQATPLFVDKQGLEQEVYDFAHTQPLAYGLIAVLLAVAAGWIASVVFRRS
jgi:uncharacterized protein (TIGR02186 family)